MVILAGSSALLSPLLLTLLLPWVSAGQTVQIDPPGLIATLLLTQLLPLLAGTVIRHWRPPLAAGLLGPCGLASKILNLAVMVLILATQFQVNALTNANTFARLVREAQGSASCCGPSSRWTGTVWLPP